MVKPSIPTRVSIFITTWWFSVVARCIHLPVPAVLHKVHRLATGAVTAAMCVPVPFVPRWHPQVDRLTHHRPPVFNDHRLRVDHHRLRHPAKVDPAIEPGLGDVDRDPHIRSENRAGQRENTQASGQGKGWFVHQTILGTTLSRPVSRRKCLGQAPTRLRTQTWGSKYRRSQALTSLW